MFTTSTFHKLIQYDQVTRWQNLLEFDYLLAERVFLTADLLCHPFLILKNIEIRLWQRNLSFQSVTVSGEINISSLDSVDSVIVYK